jgi:hypothetical protein
MTGVFQEFSDIFAWAGYLEIRLETQTAVNPQPITAAIAKMPRKVVMVPPDF